MAQFVYSNSAYVDTTLNRIVGGSNGLVIDPVSPSDGFEQNFSVYPGLNNNVNIAHYFGDIYANTYSGAALSNNWFISSINSTTSNMNLTVNGGLVASCNVAFAATGCNTCVIRKRSWYMQGFWNGLPTYCNVFASVSPLIDQGDFRYSLSNCYLDDIQLQGVDNVLVPTDATYPGAPFVFGKLTCSNIISPQINYNSNAISANAVNLSNVWITASNSSNIAVFSSNCAVATSNSAVFGYVQNSNFSVSSNTLSNSIIVNEINAIPQNYERSLDFQTPGWAAYKNEAVGCLTFSSNPLDIGGITENYQSGFSAITKFNAPSGGTIFQYNKSGFWLTSLVTSNNTARFQAYNSNVLAIDTSITINQGVTNTIGLLYSTSNFQMYASDGSNTSSNIATISNNLQNIVNTNERFGYFTGNLYGHNWYSNVIPPSQFVQSVGLMAAQKTTQIMNSVANVGVSYSNATKYSRFIESNMAHVTVGSNLVVTQNAYVGCNLTTSNALSNLGQGYFASNVVIGSNLSVGSNILIGNPNPAYLSGALTMMSSSNFMTNGIMNYGIAQGPTDIGFSYTQNGVTSWGMVGRSGYGSNTGGGRIAIVQNLWPGAAGLEVACWDIYGNMGLATTTPQYLLDVNGSAQIRSNAILFGNVSNYGYMYQGGGILTGQGNTSAGMIETRYTYSNVGDRYGIAQGALGTMRMYASGYFSGSTVGLSLLTSTNGFSDALVCGQYGQYGSNYTVISGVLSNLGPAFFVNNVSVNGNLTSAITTFASNAAYYGSNTATSVSNALPLYATNSTVNANSNFIFPIGIYGSNTANYASNALANYQTSASGTVTSSNIVAKNITASNSLSNLGPSFFASTINMSNVSSQFNLYGSNGLTQVYSHTDGNTYFQGQNNISICPANGIINPYIFVNSNTRFVGVNTNSPNYNLDVNGTGNVSGNLRVGGIASAASFATGYGGVALNITGYSISNAIQTSYTGIGDTMNITVPGNSGYSNPALTLATNGPTQRVGVLQAPSYPFDVVGTTRIATSNANTGTGDNTNNPTPTLILKNTVTYPRFVVQSADSSISCVYNFEAGKQVCFGENSSAAVQNTFNFRGPTVFTASNVGIGNSSPQYTLDVSGNANFTGSITSASGNTLAAMIETKYPSSNNGDRYGLWQGNGGIMRMYTSGLYQPATVGLSFTTSNNGYYDALYCTQGTAYGFPSTTMIGNVTINNPITAYTNTQLKCSANNQPSITLTNNYPTLGFNVLFSNNIGYSAHSGSTNFYSGNMYQNPANGYIYLNQSTSAGAAGAAVPSYNTGFTFTPTNYLGIGNQSPNNSIDIYSSGNAIINTVGSNFSALQLNATNGASTAIYAYTDGKSYIQAQNDLVINKAGGTTGTIYLYGQNSTGYVGINTLNPQYNLDVSGSIRCTSIITASNSTTSSLANNWRAFVINTGNGGRANPSSFNQLQYKVSPADPDIVYINGYGTIAGLQNFYNGSTFSMQASDSNLFPAANRNVGGTYVYSPTGGVGTTSFKIDSSGNLTGLQVYTSAAANGSNITFSINSWFPRTGI